MARLLTGMDEPLAAERLVERARGGDRAAGDALVRAFAPEVYGLLFRVVRSHEDAEDLTQETFVRALGALDLYRGDAPFVAWLLRIAVHVGRDHVRRRGRKPDRLALEALRDAGREVADPRASDAMRAVHDSDVLARALARALDALPVSLRAALALRVLEGREYGEVAAALGVRPATARTQVMKARRALARLLAPWLGPRLDASDRQGGRSHEGQ